MSRTSSWSSAPARRRRPSRSRRWRAERPRTASAGTGTDLRGRRRTGEPQQPHQRVAKCGLGQPHRASTSIGTRAATKAPSSASRHDDVSAATTAIWEGSTPCARAPAPRPRPGRQLRAAPHASSSTTAPSAGARAAPAARRTASAPGAPAPASRSGPRPAARSARGAPPSAPPPPAAPRPAPGARARRAARPAPGSAPPAIAAPRAARRTCPRTRRRTPASRPTTPAGRPAARRRGRGCRHGRAGAARPAARDSGGEAPPAPAAALVAEPLQPPFQLVRLAAIGEVVEDAGEAVHEAREAGQRPAHPAPPRARSLPPPAAAAATTAIRPARRSAEHRSNRSSKVPIEPPSTTPRRASRSRLASSTAGRVGTTQQRLVAGVDALREAVEQQRDLAAVGGTEQERQRHHWILRPAFSRASLRAEQSIRSRR